jgi:hypothetical protein
MSAMRAGETVMLAIDANEALIESDPKKLASLLSSLLGCELNRALRFILDAHAKRSTGPRGPSRWLWKVLMMGLYEPTDASSRRAKQMELSFARPAPSQARGTRDRGRGKPDGPTTIGAVLDELMAQIEERRKPCPPAKD